MPFPGALSGGNYTTLRNGSGYFAEQYLSLCPNNTVFQGTVGAGSFGNTFAAIDYSATISGSASDIKIGQRFMLGPTKRSATYVGRIRKAVSGSTIYINETSRYPVFGDYIWVIDDYPLLDRLARIDPTTNIYYKDYDITYRGLLPVIGGVQSAYAGFVDSGTNKLRIAFNAASSFAANSGSSISTFAWTFPGSATVISGSTGSSAVTMDFVASDGDWCSLTITDSGGRTQTMHFIVFPHDATHLPALGFSGAKITGNIDQGWSASTEAFTGVDTVMDQTFCAIWDIEYYAGTKTTIGPSNVKMVGRMRNESNTSDQDERYSSVTSTRYQIEGIAPVMGGTQSPSIALRQKAAASVWDEIVNMTMWRETSYMLSEHSTVLNIASMTADSTADTYIDKLYTVSKGGLLGASQNIGRAINAQIFFAAQGELYFARDARYQTTTERNALTTVADWTTSDLCGTWTLDVEHIDPNGRATASGASYNTTTGNLDPYKSVSPGEAQTSDAGEVDLPGQVLTANADYLTATNELVSRSANYLAANNGRVRLNVQHPDGYNFLMPNRFQWYTFTLPASEFTSGRAYTTSNRWQLVSINVDHDNEKGTKVVQCQYELETLGTGGIAYRPQAPADTPPSLPPTPGDPYFNFPNDPDIGVGGIDGVDTGGGFPGITTGGDTSIPIDGSLVIFCEGDKVWRTTQFKASDSPPFVDITPPNSTNITAFQYDQTRSDGKLGGYVSGDDGTNSYIDYTENVLSNPVVWTRGDSVVGIYPDLRVTNTAGSVVIRSQNAAGNWTETFDFATGQHGWTAFSGRATWTGSAWAEVFTPGVTDGIYILSPTALSTIGAVVVTVYYSAAISGSNPRTAISDKSGSPIIASDTSTGVTQVSISCTIADTAFIANFDPKVGDLEPTTETITKIVVSGVGTNPFTGGGGTDSTITRLSTDYGATFAAPVVVDSTTVTHSGFDVQRVGSVTLAGADAQGFSATTLGGAYSSLGSDGATSGSYPTLLQLPWKRWGSTTLTNFSTSTPDYLLGSNALVTGQCLWRVNGSGGRTGITPSGVTSIPNTNCSTTYNGTRAGVIGSVSGTRHLFTSITIGSTDTWSDRGALNAAAGYIRFRRVGGSGKEIYVANGTNIQYTKDTGATLITKTTPATTDIIVVEPWG